jgi:hypothetical protein
MTRLNLQGPLPITAPLVLNPLMARMVEAAGGATGYQKVERATVETGRA